MRVGFTLLLSIGIASLGIASVRPGPAFALNTEVKRSVFGDCAAVESSLATLPADQRKELVRYLGRVLRMETDVIAEVVNEPALPVNPRSPTGNPIDGFNDRNIWRTFNPTREVEAKRCATRMLEKLAPESFAGLPALLSVVRNGSFAADVRREALLTTWKIAVATARGSAAPLGEEMIRPILTLWEQDEHFLVENILVETHASSVPFLIQRLKSAEPALRSRLINLLLRIDPHGDLIGDKLLPLLQLADEDLRARILNLLSELKAFSHVSFPLVVRHLEEPSAVASEAARGALVRMIQAGNSVPLGEPECDVLTRNYEQISQGGPQQVSDTLGPPMVNCIRSFERFYQQALGPLKSTLPDVRRRALRLLSGTVTDGTYSSELFQLLSDATTDPDPRVRQEAIRAIGFDKKRQAEIVKAFARILKKLSKETVPAARKDAILAIAEALPETAEAQALIAPYAAEVLGVSLEDALGGPSRGRPGNALENGSEEAELRFAPIRILVQRGKASVPALLRAAQDADALTRSRALLALSHIEPAGTQTIRTAAAALYDVSPAVQQRARSLLKRQSGEIARSELRRVLKQKSTDPFPAAEVLLALGSEVPGAEKIVLTKLSNGNCDEFAAFASRLESFSGIEADAQARRIIECFATPNIKSDPLVQHFLRVKTATSVSALEAALLGEQSSKIDTETRVSILEKSSAFGFSREFVVRFGTGLLGEITNIQRIRVLDFLGHLTPSATEAAPALTQLLQGNSGDSIVKLHAMIALLRIVPGQVGIESVVNLPFEGNVRSWAGVVVQLDDGQLSPLLSSMLARPDTVFRRRALATVKQAGRRVGEHVIAQTEQLSQAEDAEIALDATFALLASAPERAESALRRELVGSHARSLAAERWGDAERTLLRNIKQASLSFTEMRAAERILRKLGER